MSGSTIFLEFMSKSHILYLLKMFRNFSEMLAALSRIILTSVALRVTSSGIRLKPSCFYNGNNKIISSILDNGRYLITVKFICF